LPEVFGGIEGDWIDAGDCKGMIVLVGPVIAVYPLWCLVIALASTGLGWKSADGRIRKCLTTFMGWMGVIWRAVVEWGSNP
jgi:hypothetical protein